MTLTLDFHDTNLKKPYPKNRMADYGVPTASCESKLGIFNDLSRTKPDILRALMENLTMQICWNILLKWRNLSLANVPKGPFHWNEWFLHVGWKLAKYNYPSIQAAYKTDLIIPEHQTFIYQSAKNKEFCCTFLQTLLELSTFPVPKDPRSKVRTFPGYKDPWELLTWKERDESS